MTALSLRCRARRGGFDLSIDAELDRPSTGIFGRSGSGKSSLLLALAGLVPAEELRLVVGGDVLVDTANGIAPPPHRRGVGLVFQDHRLLPHRSVERNLRYGMTRDAGGPPFDEVVDLLELRPLLRRSPGSCSGGERQRVAIGRALLAAPRVLAMDEPLASLDRGLRRQLLPYLRRVRERFDVPLLVVSHDLGDLLALTDELLLLENGQLAGHGAPWELAQRAETLDLLHDCGLVFALSGEVERRDDGGVTWLRLAGAGGTAAGDQAPDGVRLGCGGACDAAVGERVEALVRPEDVILARPPLDARLSLTNHIDCRVSAITRTDERCLVTLDAGLALPILAEVTERAIQRLELAPGVQVVALMKAQAIRTRPL